MKSKLSTFELTVASSKGQVIIPKNLREHLKIKKGSVFAVSASEKNNILLLKKLDDPILETDIKIMKEVENAWEDIENGKSRKMNKEKFMKVMNKW
jgi:AbrB family looped-hinge helix DNA binding protein